MMDGFAAAEIRGLCCHPQGEGAAAADKKKKTV
jgi:hypothetical protein